MDNGGWVLIGMIAFIALSFTYIGLKASGFFYRIKKRWNDKKQK